MVSGLNWLRLSMVGECDRPASAGRPFELGEKASNFRDPFERLVGDVKPGNLEELLIADGGLCLLVYFSTMLLDKGCTCGPKLVDEC